MVTAQAWSRRAKGTGLGRLQLTAQAWSRRAKGTGLGRMQLSIVQPKMASACRTPTENLFVILCFPLGQERGRGTSLEPRNSAARHLKHIGRRPSCAKPFHINGSATFRSPVAAHNDVASSVLALCHPLGHTQQRTCARDPKPCRTRTFYWLVHLARQHAPAYNVGGTPAVTQTCNPSSPTCQCFVGP